jgi:predicted Zn finger-like uncharacterized protein
MPVEPRCPSCHAACPITDDDIGKKVRCEKCEHVFTVKARTIDPDEDEDGTNASPWMQDAEVARRKGHAEQTGEAAKRSGKEKADEEDRDDDPSGKDPPRSRRSRESDEDDAPPARRGGSVAKKRSGGRLGLVLGLAGGAAALLLLCGGVAAWLVWAKFSDSPNVTVGNFERVQPNVPLADVEAFFGRGREWSAADVTALLNNPHLRLGNNRVKTVAGNPQQFGIARWYRWTNGPTTMFVGLDAAGRVRAAGLVTITSNRTESYFKSNV